MKAVREQKARVYITHSESVCYTIIRCFFMNSTDLHVRCNIDGFVRKDDQAFWKIINNYSTRNISHSFLNFRHFLIFSSMVFFDMSIAVTTIYKRSLAVGTCMSLFRFHAYVSDVPSQWASSFRGDAIADRASCWTSLSIASMYFMILEIKKNHLSINMLWGRCCDGSQRKWRLSSQKILFSFF